MISSLSVPSCLCFAPRCFRQHVPSQGFDHQGGCSTPRHRLHHSHQERINPLTVDSYKYLGVWLDSTLDWSKHTSNLYGKVQSRMYFLRRLQSFNICSKLLCMFYQSVIASVLFYTVVCWGGSTSKKDTSRVGMKLDSLVTVAEARTLNKLMDIMADSSHPLHTVISSQRSLFSDRLLLPKCRTNRLKNSFVPSAIRLYNASLGARR
ncbi:uncharacterized protein ACNS7B_015119 [Menidia menidia]